MRCFVQFMVLASAFDPSIGGKSGTATQLISAGAVKSLGQFRKMGHERRHQGWPMGMTAGAALRTKLARDFKDRCWPNFWPTGAMSNEREAHQEIEERDKDHN